MGVRKVFTNKRSSFEIFLSITWKPFDERFKDIMENFQHHKEIVVQEVTAQTVMRFHRTDTIGEQQRLSGYFVL